MTEYWCEYEARINWLQMYERPNDASSEVTEEATVQNCDKIAVDCTSPESKRRRSGSLYKLPNVHTRPVSCEQCECIIQYYEGDQNRTYSSSATSFIPTGAEIWPAGIIADNCIDDEGLSAEALSFLNAQNDYFGPGGEYIADRIEKDFDLRWDYDRARQLCIAHLDPLTMNLKDLHFACCRGRRLISFWKRFESLEKQSQVAWNLGGQDGHVNFPEFYLYWRPDFAGPHVQLQTGSLTGGFIPSGVVWPRRWWKEALRRRNSLIDLRQKYGSDSLKYLEDLILRVQSHITNILMVKNIEVMNEVVRSKTSRHLKTVLDRIQRYSNDMDSTDPAEADPERFINFDHKYHQPLEIESLSTTLINELIDDGSHTKRLIMSYFCMHEYLCSTIGAARLRFRAETLNQLKTDVELNLLASQDYYENN